MSGNEESRAEAPEPVGVAAAGRPATSTLTAVVVAVVVIAALYVGSEVLIPITLAVLLSFVLAPLMELLRRLWLPRVVSALLSVLLAIGVILALGGIIGTQIAGLAGQVPQYQTTIERKVASLRELIGHELAGRISFVTNGLRNLGVAAPGGASQPAAPAAHPEPEPARTPVPVVITQSPASSALELGQRILRPILHPLATLGIILVVAIFTLLQKEDLRDRLIRLFGADDLHRATLAMDDAGGRLTRYFLTQLSINCVFGVIVGSGLFVIGVPSPVLWGILGALLRFVPYIGSYIALALPVLLAAAVGSGWSMAVATAVLFIVTELVLGQAVEPLVYGHSTGLSPFAVIVAAIFWAWIWGPLGLILSTPLTLCLVVLGRHVEPLEFLAVLLGDRPALSPTENFYQRVLAGDPSEAEDHAERYLARRSLSEYYDEVAVPGLRMASVDARRGVLSGTAIERVRAVVNELMQDLAWHADTAAGGPGVLREAWRGGTPVLCIAGRGALDEAAAAMLAQLLGKHGIGARVVPYRTVSQERVHALDVAGVKMACVSYLDIAGGPVHLRSLIRRLRLRLPEARILVGVWGAEDPFLRDTAARRAMGADMYVTSLREAAEACLASARA